MVEEAPEIKKSKGLEITIAVVLIAITIIAVVYLNFYYVNENQVTNNKPVLSTTYSGLDPEVAYNLMNNSEDLLIIDISSCQCKWKGNCINLSAVWDVNPESFFNETRDILVYDYSGSDSVSFCESLVNHTYGKIYCIEGGTTAWKQYGYPTYNCS